MGAYEALIATGKPSTFIYYNDFATNITNVFQRHYLLLKEMRYAAILGYVGAGGIGMILNEKIGWREFQSVGMILLSIFVAVVIIETTSQKLRKHLS